MTAIWAAGRDSWRQLDPAGFPNEASLHQIVATSPELLPLSGGPSLVVLGREVLLGSGYADVVAIESTGRPVVIEVKLRNNSESRRAVVAQILAYASALHGLSHHELEHDVLARYLPGQSLLEVVQRSEAVQEGIDAEEFAEALSASLRDGGFRLVLVLDQVPDELVTLVGYLESVTEALIIDLITITAYEIEDQRIVVPQRVAPEPQRRSGGEAAPAERVAATPSRRGQIVTGSGPFAEAIQNAPAAMRADLTRLADLGAQLEADDLANVVTYFAKRGEVTLLPRLRPDNVGLVTFWYRTDGRASVTPWRSVFERRAPNSIHRFEQAAAPAPLAQGNEISAITDELLTTIHAAYEEASQGPHEVGSARTS